MIWTGEVTSPKRVTLTTWGPPPPYKQALSTSVYGTLKFARFQSRTQSLLGTALPRWPKSQKTSTLDTKLGVRGVATCTHGSLVRTQKNWGEKIKWNKYLTKKIGFQRSDDINWRTESWMIYLYSRLDYVKRERVVFFTTSLHSRRNKAQLRHSMCGVFLGKKQSSVN